MRQDLEADRSCRSDIGRWRGDGEGGGGVGGVLRDPRTARDHSCSLTGGHDRAPVERLNRSDVTVLGDGHVLPP